MNKTGWIVAVVAFILGFVVSWVIFDGGVPRGETPVAGEEAEVNSEQGEAMGKDGEENGETMMEQKSSVTITGEGSIAVSDQGFGDAVSIDSVTLQNGGWIAIHEERDGELGNILGAGWFPVGVSEDIEVQLLRGTVPGALYYAVLRSDDGDRSFDHTKDLPLEDAEGKLLQTTFRTNSLEIEF